MLWKLRVFGQMPDDDLADGVGIDESDVTDKGNEVVMQDHRLKVQVQRHVYPGDEIGAKAIKGLPR